MTHNIEHCQQRHSKVQHNPSSNSHPRHIVRITPYSSTFNF
ncbi:Uncharacterized protein ChrSV_3912 [Chromobacterium vaccinii]|nr:Uncharacterized protein ChrSW_3912 [Chromobacterium vaccinii]QND91369.1 Uncharacterized protein ChrSV_3912 [Chromobacterium vaccinii]